MHSSLRLFWTGLSVLALGVASCSSTTLPLGFDGGGGTSGPTDGPKTDGPKTDGAKSDAMDARGPDLNVPPPVMLTATVFDRRATTFELLWTAPSNGGAAVSGYQARYAKVPITATNFDDTTMTTAVPYSGTPKAPGDTDGMIVKAYIENGYYFAVIGTDSANAHVGPLMATATAVTAHFNITTLAGTTGSATEGAGFAIDGSGDANGDGRSDVLVGSFNGSRAYLFFGGTGFAPTVPAVVFSSAVTTSGFGQGVAYIGDINNDGREDLAIAARTTNQVFIYKGRTTWPATLTDTNADFTITTDSTYASSLFGTTMSRLGDFNGDGVDDFAIGAPDFNATTLAGRATIILGASSFSSLALPSATRSIVIDGDPALTYAAFGSRVLGIGHFYSGSSTLIVSAPGFVGAPSSTEGRIYAFHGQAGTSGVINIASADKMLVGAAAGLRIGAALADLGPIVGALPSVGSGNPNDTSAPVGAGSVYVFSGNTTTGPFGSKQTFYQTGASLTGSALIGGGIPGRDTSVSVIGSASPDLVVLPRNGMTFGIVDGAKVSSLGTPIDIAAKADVLLTLPSTFTLPATGSVLPDADGDGYPDFAISNGASTVAGQTLVYW